MPWTFLGEGSYNLVYKNDTGDLVFKVQQQAGDDSDLYDAPERSTELMRELYPEFADRIEIITDPIKGTGWTFPFIEGEHPTDDEIVEALIDIFNKTGRILLDGCLYENFIRTSATHPTYPNRTFCIDIGMLVNIQGKDTSGVGGRMRRKSETSDNMFVRNEKFCYRELWGHRQTKKLFSTHLIQALILIRKYRPSIVDVSVLKDNPAFIKKLGFLYQKNLELRILMADKALLPEERELALSEYKKLPERTDAALRELDTLITRTRAAKETCRNLLNAYIKTRGVIDEKTNAFKPSFTTYWFRNHSLTLFKVQKTRDIISAIDNASSDEAIKTILQQAKSDRKIVQSSFHSGLENALSRCERLLKPGA